MKNKAVILLFALVLSGNHALAGQCSQTLVSKAAGYIQSVFHPKATARKKAAVEALEELVAEDKLSEHSSDFVATFEAQLIELMASKKYQGKILSILGALVRGSELSINEQDNGNRLPRFAMRGLVRAKSLVDGQEVYFLMIPTFAMNSSDGTLYEKTTHLFMFVEGQGSENNRLEVIADDYYYVDGTQTRGAIDFNYELFVGSDSEALTSKYLFLQTYEIPGAMDYIGDGSSKVHERGFVIRDTQGEIVHTIW